MNLKCKQITETKATCTSMSTQSHAQKPNDMSDTSKTMKKPKHATNLPEPPISTPPIYLPLWRQSTKKEGWSELVLGRRD